MRNPTAIKVPETTSLGVPGPSTGDMVRAFRSIRADPLTFLVATQERYGNLVAFPVPGPPTLLVNDPVDVRRVLQTSARHWGKETAQYRALRRVTGPGLLASSEPTWIDHRRIAAPAFHHGRLTTVADQVAAITDDALSSWRVRSSTAGPVDVADLSLRIALDVVGRALFSADLSARAQQLLEATGEAAGLVVRVGRSVLPLPDWVPTPINRRLRAVRHELDTLSFELIRARRRGSHGSNGDDLLGLLLDSGLDDQQIRDELVTMVVAGHETVAAALAWTLMLLAEDQPAQDRLRAEVNGLSGPVPMVGTAAQVPWTRAVVDEALRIYPPAWVLSRRSRQPDVIGGMEVPVGTTAIVSPWLLHRQAELFSEPLEFSPARFLERTGSPPGYLPFGQGPRLCIGREFALGEIVIVLSRLLTAYRVDVPVGWSAPTPEALVAVHPRGGMPLVVTPVGPAAR